MAAITGESLRNGGEAKRLKILFFGELIMDCTACAVIATAKATGKKTRPKTRHTCRDYVVKRCLNCHWHQRHRGTNYCALCCRHLYPQGLGNYVPTLTDAKKCWQNVQAIKSEYGLGFENPLLYFGGICH